MFLLSDSPHLRDIEHKLLHDLFLTNYSKEARPVLNKSDVVEVKFDLAYAQLINLVSFASCAQKSTGSPRNMNLKRKRRTLNETKNNDNLYLTL